MTPKLAAYLKKEHGQFVTGTMKKNTKNLDKSLLFKKNMKIGRGFYTWSEDQDNGVTQAVWMDREVGFVQAKTSMEVDESTRCG